MLHVECLLSGLLCSPPSSSWPASVMGCKVVPAQCHSQAREEATLPPSTKLINLHLLTPAETACRLDGNWFKNWYYILQWSTEDVSIILSFSLSAVHTASHQEQPHFVEINYFPQDAHVSIHWTWTNGWEEEFIRQERGVGHVVLHRCLHQDWNNISTRRSKWDFCLSKKTCSVKQLDRLDCVCVMDWYRFGCLWDSPEPKTAVTFNHYKNILWVLFAASPKA